MNALDFQFRPTGAAYDHLFPRATMQDTTVKRGASVTDTVRAIPEVVRLKRWQIKKYVDRELRGLSRYEACKKLWHFLKQHVAYKKDENNSEQIRTPARLWHDRFTGVDCDCYTTTIACALSLLNIPVVLRITKYKDEPNRFKHIYPIVPVGGGKYITMDCVVGAFNKEEPFIEKQDYPMDLQILDGIYEDASIYGSGARQHQYNDEEGMAELGRILKKKINLKNTVKKAGTAIKNTAKTVAKTTATTAKKAVHTINRVNPATLALRNGLLAAMKLNMMNVAADLKWSYLSDGEAQKRGIDMARFSKLKAVREKLDRIFFSAGGKPENLKQAILSGKGNPRKDVPMSGLEGMDEYTPLRQLLGEQIYYSENVEGMEGAGQLGEPVTAAAVTAASGVIATIAGLIKSIGDIFPKKNKTAAANTDTPTTTPPLTSPSNTPSAETSVEEETSQDNSLPPDPAASDESSIIVTTPDDTTSDAADQISTEQRTVPGATSKTTAVKTTAPTQGDTASFWERNKKWAKPVAYGAGGLFLAIALYKAFSKKPPDKPVSGIKPSKAHHRHKQHKTEIALM